MDALKEEDGDNVTGEASLNADRSEFDDNHSAAFSAAAASSSSLILCSCFAMIMVLFTHNTFPALNEVALLLISFKLGWAWGRTTNSGLAKLFCSVSCPGMGLCVSYDVEVTKLPLGL